MKTAFVIPAYEAEKSVGVVVSDLISRITPELETTRPAVIVVDDGSRDATAQRAEQAGAHVLRHVGNRGKGAALLTGFRYAAALSGDVVVTLDADGQHPPEQAIALARHPASPEALVLGIRDLRRAGAPRANRFSNGFSNLWVSGFSRQRLNDTQCGLRRYPLAAIASLGLAGSGFELESEVIIKAARAGVPIEQVPVEVIYPAAEERVSHFDSVRDPARIVARILYTAATTSFKRAPR
ncbi:MAG TPA: glycosyltransferase family 2 protein [Polyangiaceae bacterium]|nr:glycosyltransferase family 2 protein [Polyangiaceae bacterium]